MAWFTDNQNVVSIASGGSRVKDLQSLALEIFELCVTNCISLEMKRILRDLNTKADCLSRIIDFDDYTYTLNDDLFKMLDVRWGPHSVERFACSYNTKLARFTPGFICLEQKQLMHLLKIGNTRTIGYCLIVRAINYLKQCRAEGSIAVPVWKLSYFWTVLSRDGRHRSPFVHDWLLLPDHECLFVGGKAKNRFFGAKRLFFKVAALRVKFNVSE